MAGKVKRNSKRIGAKFRTEALLWALIFGVIGFVLGYLGVGMILPGRQYALVGGLLCCAVLFVIALIIGLVFAGIRTGRIMKQVQNKVLFDTDTIHEAGNSGYIFLGDHFLVWNKGRKYRIIAKEEIVSAENHPEMQTGNALGLLVVEKTDGTAVQLAYELKEGIDLPAIVNEWVLTEI